MFFEGIALVRDFFRGFGRLRRPKFFFSLLYHMLGNLITLADGKGASGGGGICGIIILVALLIYSIKNLTKLSQVKKAGLDPRGIDN